MRMEGKVAIVAGAAWGGIGGASALALAREGAKVVVNTRSNVDKLGETLKRIEEAGGEAIAVPGDASKEATWKKLVETALSRFGGLTTLVYNPAKYCFSPVADITREQWDETLEVSLTGAWIAARHCLPQMVKGGGGSVVFVSSVNGSITNPHFGAYSAAKAGLNALTRSIALDYGAHGIRANAVAPGSVVGERSRARLEADVLEDSLSKDCYPLGRYGRPEEIGAVVLFLASDESSFVTGIVLTADGGLTIQSPEALVKPSFRRKWRDDILIPSKMAGGAGS